MKKFYAIIGNPPYQEETTQKEPTSNGQKPVKSIFNDFQDEADKIAYGSVELVYPGGRWIHQSGKGMQDSVIDRLMITGCHTSYFTRGRKIYSIM